MGAGPAGAGTEAGEGTVAAVAGDDAAAKLLAQFQSSMVLDRWWQEWWRTRGDSTVAGEAGAAGDTLDFPPPGKGAPHVTLPTDPLTLAKLTLCTKS